MENKISFQSFLLLCITIAGISSCDLQGKKQTTSQLPPKTDTLAANPQVQVQELPLLLDYHLDSLETSDQADSLELRFSTQDLAFIYNFNRIDPNRVKAGTALVIPDSLTGNLLDYSPFPLELEMLDSIPKTVLISKRVQAFGLYEDKKLVHWGAISSGKKSTPTPEGLFYGNYKARSKVSTVDESWILPYYFNFLNFDGVGVHQYAMPGYPASHACVRLFKKDAMTIYNWAQQWKLDSSGRFIVKNGTPFMVFGAYDFESPVPWLRLVEDPHSNYLTAGEMDVLRSYVSAYWKDSLNFDPPAEAGNFSQNGSVVTME